MTPRNGRAPTSTPHAEYHDHHSFPFPSSSAAPGYEFPPPHSYPSSPPSQQQLQQPFTYPSDSDDSDEATESHISQSSSTTSIQTTMPGRPIPSPAKRTLRRMANSVPIFQLGAPNNAPAEKVMAEGYSSGVDRPKMTRQRSRSGPQEGESVEKGSAGRLQVPVGGQGRAGWVAQTITGVVGRMV